MKRPYLNDMKASASIPGIGSGHKHGYGHEDQGTNCATIDICPDLLFGAIFAAGAAAFAAFYVAITMAGRRRRKREIKDNFVKNVDSDKFVIIQDIIFAGMFYAQYKNNILMDGYLASSRRIIIMRS